MVTREENELLTRLEGDAPMGRLMRDNYWIPFALRRTSCTGRPRCRCASSARTTSRSAPKMAVSASSTNSARTAAPHCSSGASKATPSAASTTAGRSTSPAASSRPDPGSSDASGSRRALHVDHFPVHEAGGLAWVWLGGGEAPPFPELPFGDDELPVLVRLARPVQLAPGCRGHHRFGARRHAAPHLDAREPEGGRDTATSPSPSTSPRPTRPRRLRHGMRAAALRRTDDGRTYVRITEHLMPLVTVVPVGRGRPATAPCSCSRRWTTPTTCCSTGTSPTRR